MHFTFIIDPFSLKLPSTFFQMEEKINFLQDEIAENKVGKMESEKTEIELRNLIGMFLRIINLHFFSCRKFTFMTL